MKTVLKNKAGDIIGTPFGPNLHFMLSRCHGHKVVWGPKCRNMKRKPKGREEVTIECKTCGDYLEDIQG